jgi:hypothetical protein
LQSEAKMKMRKEGILWNALLGTGVYLLESLRERTSSAVDDLSSAAQDTYSEASRRVSRASDAIRGQDDHSGLQAAAALLLGIGVGVGVGMLLAPASGEETRGNISKQVHRVSGRVRDKFSSEPPATGTYGA